LGDIFSTVKVNMAAEPQVLITSLLQKMETPFQSRNGVIEHVHDLDRQQWHYPRWRAIPGSGDN